MSIARIKEAIDLRELAREYGGFKAFGEDLVGRCLMHEEKTASLRIHRNSFHCFGCGANGSAVDWLVALDGISVGQAMRALSERTGIPLAGNQRLSPVQKVLYKEEREFAEWWKARLLSREGKRLTCYVKYADPAAVEIGEALSYVRGLRGLDLRQHVAERSTLADRAEWRADVEDAKYWTGWCVAALALSI